MKQQPAASSAAAGLATANATSRGGTSMAPPPPVCGWMGRRLPEQKVLVEWSSYIYIALRWPCCVYSPLTVAHSWRASWRRRTRSGMPPTRQSTVRTMWWTSAARAESKSCSFFVVACARRLKIRGSQRHNVTQPHAPLQPHRAIMTILGWVVEAAVDLNTESLGTFQFITDRQ